MSYNESEQDKINLEHLASTSNSIALQYLRSSLEKSCYFVRECPNKRLAYDLEIRKDNPATGVLKAIVEVKLRNFDSTKYSTSFIETDKLNRLVKYSAKYQCSAYYLCCFNDDCALIVKVAHKGENLLSSLEPTTKYMNYHTYAASTPKVCKEIIEIPNSMFKTLHK